MKISDTLCCIFLIPVFLFLTGCSETEKKQKTVSQVSDNSISYGDSLISEGAVVTLNPLYCVDQPSWEVFGLLFSGMVRVNENLELLPDAADTWEISSDRKTIVFHLRSDIRFHDGNLLTADDVHFTYSLLLDPASGCPYSSFLTPFETVEATDQFTVTVKLKYPYAPFLVSCAHPILPEKIYQGCIHDQRADEVIPIGSGPFMFVSHVPQEQLVLKSFPDYFRGRPFLSHYVLKNIPDRSMAFLELKKGTIDALYLTSDQYVKQADTPEFLLRYNVFSFSAFISILLPNFENPLLGEKKIRQAISMLIDRDYLIKDLSGGFGTKLVSPFPLNSWAVNNELKPWPFSPEKAAELLKEAGFSDTDGDGILERDGKTLSLTLSMVIIDQNDRIRSEFLAESLRRGGFSVRLESLAFDALLSNMDQKKFDLVCIENSLVSLDPDDVFSLFHSSQIPDFENGISGMNNMSYRNPEIDQLLETGRSLLEKEERIPVYHKICEILHEDLPYIILSTSQDFFAIEKRFQGVKLSPAGLLTSPDQIYVPASLHLR